MIKQSLKKGIMTTAGLSVVTLLCQILSVAYLARKLSPEDFGMIAIIVSYFTMISIFTELSFGSNLIQRKEISKSFVTTGLVVVSFISIALFIINIFLYPLLDNYFNIGNFIVFILTSLLIIIIPMSNIVDALALKELKFKKTFRASLIANIIGVLIVPISLEKLGMGIYALVAGAILVPLLKLLLLIDELYNKITFNLNFKEFSTSLRFSIYFTFAKFLSMASLQGDRVILGLQMTNHYVGIYSRAQYFSQAVINLLTVGLERVIFPLINKLKNKEEKSEFYYETIKVTSLITMIASITLFYYSEIFVYLMLGSNWVEVIPIAKVLAFLVYIRALDKVAAIYMRTDKYVKERFIFQLIIASVTLLSVFFISGLGLFYLACGVVIVNIIGGLYTQLRLTFIFKVSFMHHIRCFKGTFIGAIIYICFLYISLNLFSIDNLLIRSLLPVLAVTPVVILVYIKPKWFFGQSVSNMILKISH